MARWYPLGVLLPLLLAGAAPPPRDGEVARQVRLLGSESFETREDASRALEGMGRSIRPILRNYRNEPDLEVRRRVREVLDRLAPLRRGPLVLDGTGSGVYAVAFSPDGKLVASGDWSPCAHFYDPATGKLLRSGKGHTGLIRRVVFTPDGKHLVSCSLDSTVRLWDVSTAREVRKFEGHVGNVIYVAVSPDGTRVASGGNDQTVRIWDLATGKEVGCIRDANRAWCVGWSKDGKQVLSGGGAGDFTLRIHDVASGKPVRVLAGHRREIHGLAVAADGKTVWTASWDGTVRVWDVATGKELRVLDGHNGEARCVALSPDGRLAASGDSTGHILLRDAGSGVVLRRLEGHTDMLNALAFSEDGGYLASGGSDGKVRIWDVADE